MAQEKQIQIQFMLKDVQQVQYLTLTDQWPDGELQIGNQINFNCDTEHRILRCLARFEFKKNDITQLMLDVQSVFEFAREGWSAMYNLQQDSWILPAGLMQHLTDITIGAARGILAVRTEESGFPRVMLPLLNPQQIIRQNARFPRVPQKPDQNIVGGAEA